MLPLLRALPLLLLIAYPSPYFGSLGAKESKEEPEGRSRFEELELFNKVLFLIEKQYYRKLDTSKLIEGAIKGMLETLDPHSTYLSKELFAKMRSDTSGEYGGVGIEVTQKDGVLYVVTPIEDGPAFRKGVMPRDRIYEINGESALGIGIEEAVDLMKGKPGSKVVLGLKRKGKSDLIKVKLVREIIKVQSVKSQLLDDGVGYLRLSQFQKTSDADMVKAMKRMKKKRAKKGMNGWILDLRSNPGGLLDQAVKISSVFLRSGVVVSTVGRGGKKEESREVVKMPFKDLETPVVVLINGASASASEIVAGALQDHERAIVMGVPSFGKGSVQTVAQVGKDIGVKLTVAQYKTPNGRHIQALGVSPDIELDEFGKDWRKHVLEDHYIRELDLRGHLNAVIERPEEKKRFEDLEKRRKKITPPQKKEEEVVRFMPARDYQVQQAQRYLRSFKVLGRLSKLRPDASTANL